MSAIATVEREIGTDLALLSTEELKAELSRQLSLTARHLTRLALIVAELENRGENMDDLKPGMLVYLRRIATGQLAPELIVRYMDKPKLLERLMLLPVQDQERLAAGEPVKMVVFRDGALDHRMVDPRELDPGQINIVFAPGRIRSETEQINWIEQRQLEGSMRPTVVKQKNVLYDEKRNTLRIGRRAEAPMYQVVDAIATARAKDDDGERTCSVSAKLTETEDKALSHRAIESGTSKAELVRKALQAMGFI